MRGQNTVPCARGIFKSYTNMTKQKRDSFLLRHDFFPQIKMLPTEQRGVLFTAIYAYATGDEMPQMDALTTLCFGFIRASLDANAKKYDAECEQNRANGRKGGRPKKAEGSDENRTVFPQSGGFSSKPDEKEENPIVSDSDPDIDSESDAVSVSESGTRDGERERLFEIFFFRNFQNPAAEVDRFINHYQATGWMRKGEPVVDKYALAQAWTQEKSSSMLRYPPGFLQCWREIYEALVAAKADAGIMLTELAGVEITRERVTLTVAKSTLLRLLEGYAALVKPILNSRYPGRALHYRVPKAPQA